MRVLHVLDHSLPLHSGYTFRTLKIIEGQRQQGIETLQVTGVRQGQVTCDIESSHGMDFIRTPPLADWEKIPLLQQWFSILALRATIDRIVKEHKPDYMHVHSPVLNGLAALPVAKKNKIPVLYEIRAFWEDAAVDHGTHKQDGLRYRFSRALETYMVKKAQHVTTICEGLKQDLVKRGISEDKITVVPNAVDHEEFTKQKVDQALKQQILDKYNLNEKYVIGFIGSFYAYEGIDLLLEATAKLKSQIERLRVILVGGGPEEDAIKQKIKDLKLEEIVYMLGRVEHEKVATYYEVCDLCVYPRKRMRLTELVTPLKPLEAMARGVPVLASNVGGHKELINSNETGFLFEAEDVTSLEKAILKCKYNSKPVEVIFRAKNYILEQRNWKTTTKVYKDVFEQCAS